MTRRFTLSDKSRRAHGEDDLQKAVVGHLQVRARKGVVWYMIRNHGKRGKASLGIDYAMGLRKGAADLGFIIPPHGSAAFLELKFGDNVQTGDQVKFGEDAEAAGAYYAVAWDIDTALSILQAWKIIR